jgi:hypothetical protein
MTSPAVQFNAQLTAGVSPEGKGADGAEVMDAWGTANTPATRARITAEYFIVTVGIV